jgi:predicted Rossmann fold nucleotide-binding protein DprA/Smf involved in DNA uptake
MDRSRLTPIPSTIVTLSPGDEAYPARVLSFLSPPGPTLRFIGDPELLRRSSLGLVCSARLPGAILLETYDFAQRMPVGERTVAGGFHSPMERQCLDILLNRHVPVLICPGRRLLNRRIPSHWRVPVGEGRLAIVSSFEPRCRRVTRALAFERNRFVAAMADILLVPYAVPGGSAERIVRQALVWKKDVLMFGQAEGEELFGEHVDVTTSRGLAAMLRSAARPDHVRRSGT